MVTFYLIAGYVQGLITKFIVDSLKQRDVLIIICYCNNLYIKYIVMYYYVIRTPVMP